MKNSIKENYIMKNNIFCIAIALFVSLATANAQLPVHLDLGAGGGVSMPTGTLSNGDNTGYHVGAKGRVSGIMPMNILAAVNYSRLPNKVGGETDVIVSASAGLEYPIPSVLIKPYFGVDLMYNSLSNTGAGSTTSSRFGTGLGGGVMFALPGVGDIDASLKYQILNLTGKNPNEDTISQIALNVSLMFGVI